ncbi:hypothetical protein [Mycobacteroides abscessus]|uniref:hypothetical protein n=1 Tax=Mycobacteroides abscessus TaxID=36809 RepID=UPI00092B1E39|nr:hypothetical protein [Mycobacteroides abscessus]SIA22802.1 Uncharacterised protein [Mycobacteroides abscessus subsp. abscessus]SKT81564.1 Uncharacterised protein [Mycobacteroides abscessus subsp. massiliense]SKT98638.1 Uncharacterised protein [Mycobacteroides abscessus subsp. massiliense]
MESKECRICHRIGYRGFVPYGESMWECSRDDLCETRRLDGGYDRHGNLFQQCAVCGADPADVGEQLHQAYQDGYAAGLQAKRPRRVKRMASPK